MKIKDITEDEILFADGTQITFYHCRSCCEWNYADFCYLKEENGIFDYDFQLDRLVFEKVDGCGFRFGDHPQRMWFVPCYSKQNGYYSCFLNILLNEDVVLDGLECELNYC